MDLRSLRARLVLAGVALAVAACSGQAPSPGQARQPAAAQPRIGYANIGGYLLAYECAGTGRPAVILEAGYTASGIDTYRRTILPVLARGTRVCTYDRAGDGLSDARPALVRPLTGATQARELHTLLHVIHVGPQYVLVGHSYGAMITRASRAVRPLDCTQVRWPGWSWLMRPVSRKSQSTTGCTPGRGSTGQFSPRRTSGSTSTPRSANSSERLAWARCP